MKKIIQVAAFLAVTLVFANVGANAQAFGKKFEANISFDFAIGDEVFRAGKYILRVAGDPNGPAVLEVRNAEYNIVFQGLVTTSGERRNTSGLRFDRSTGFPALSSIVSHSLGYSVPIASRATLIAAKGRSTNLNN